MVFLYGKQLNPYTMKTLSKLIFSCLILLTVAACKKNDDGGDGGSAGEGTITAKIGGASWTSLKMSTNASYVSAAKALTLMGTDAGGKNIKIIMNAYDGTTGSWEITSAGTAIGINSSYIETNIANPAASKTYVAPYASSGAIGRVQISEFSKTGNVKGTFNFKSRNQSDNADFKDITEGSFNIKVTSF